MNLDQAFNNQRKEIEKYEKKFKLPDMLGSERQRPWARIIRREFLTELLDKVMDATRNLPSEQASAIYRCLDKLRAENRSKAWIEKCRPLLGDAISLLLALPAAEVAAEQKKQEAAEAIKLRQEKSRQAIKDIKAAGEFEDQHGLPSIIGTGPGVKQENFGRRCRYWMLKELDQTQIERIREFLEKETTAGVWIGAFLKEKTMFDLMYPEAKCQSEADVRTCQTSERAVAEKRLDG